MNSVNALNTVHWLEWGGALLPKNEMYQSAIKLLVNETIPLDLKTTEPLKDRDISLMSNEKLIALISKDPAKKMELLERIICSFANDELRILDFIELIHYLKKTNQIEALSSALQKLEPSIVRRLLRDILNECEPATIEDILKSSLNGEKLQTLLNIDKPEPYVWPIFKDTIAWHEQKVMECNFDLSITPTGFPIPNALRELHEKYLYEIQKLEDKAVKENDPIALARIRQERKRYYNESLDKVGKCRQPAIIDQEIKQAVITKNTFKIGELVKERLTYNLSDPVQKRSRMPEEIWAEWEPFVNKNIESRELWSEALTCLLKDQINPVPEFREDLPINAKISHLFKLFRQKELTDYIIKLRNQRIKNQSLISPISNDADLFEEKAFKLLTSIAKKHIRPALKNDLDNYLNQHTRDKKNAVLLQKLHLFVEHNLELSNDLQSLSIQRLNCQDVNFIRLIQDLLNEGLTNADKQELIQLRNQHALIINEAVPLLVRLGWKGQSTFLEASKAALENWMISPKDLKALYIDLYRDYAEWKKRHSYASEPEPPFDRTKIEDFLKDPAKWLIESQNIVEKNIAGVKEEAALPYLTTDQLKTKLNKANEGLKLDEWENKYFLYGQYYRSMDAHINHLKWLNDCGTLTVELLKHSIHADSPLWKIMLETNPKLEPLVKAILFKEEIGKEMKQIHEMMHRPNVRKFEEVEIGVEDPALYFVEKLNNIYQIYTADDLHKLGIAKWSDIPNYIKDRPEFFKAFLEFEKSGKEANIQEFMKKFNV